MNVTQNSEYCAQNRSAALATCRHVYWTSHIEWPISMSRQSAKQSIHVGLPWFCDNTFICCSLCMPKYLFQFCPLRFSSLLPTSGHIKAPYSLASQSMHHHQAFLGPRLLINCSNVLLYLMLYCSISSSVFPAQASRNCPVRLVTALLWWRSMPGRWHLLAGEAAWLLRTAVYCHTALRYAKSTIQ